MNAAVICVGRLKERWQREGCAEYLKRLTRYGSYEIIELADEPEPAKPAAALEAKVLEVEGRRVLARVKDADFVAALMIGGERLSSEAFAGRTREWERRGKRVALVIGGSLGLSAEVIARADAQISFSDMTFPHPLMRVILLEQLYRAARINAGERYHK